MNHDADVDVDMLDATQSDVENPSPYDIDPETTSVSQVQRLVSRASASGSNPIRWRKAIVVTDTNFLISRLQTVKELANPAYQNICQVTVPWIVVTELDGLKSSKSADVASRARRATRWLVQSLQAGLIRGQRKSESIESGRSLHGDDAILDCCTFFQEQLGLPCLLLSDDMNLGAKALIHDIRVRRYDDSLNAEQVMHEVRGLKALGNGMATEEEQTSCEMDTDAVIAPYTDGSDNFFPLVTAQESNGPLESASCESVRSDVEMTLLKAVPKLLRDQLVYQLALDGLSHTDAIDSVQYLYAYEKAAEDISSLIEAICGPPGSMVFDRLLRGLGDTTRAVDLRIVLRPKLKILLEPDIRPSEDWIRCVTLWIELWSRLATSKVRSAAYISKMRAYTANWLR
ncbi:hypothetical protein PYCC9005_002458 [Savitreella phatthalungensis]